ncbi:UvrD-helicase domain-containing protein [Spongiibacter sp. KMU-166]|uniref:DNA 3'-5' helicase n=1 Tax=Spongiibacter thalassae TaxID=2721624 RepID=A0ABX1GI87_9GAMM|nr:UvrD-helicase domain-containing protein [Spongiibacter thalassae]NKI18187.1 UvrD-helicase domain-containing protein [Spongiibacter thalassae]
MTELLLPPDQDARDLAVDPARSVLLRAPAGSGKTGVLLLRYLRCLLRVDRPEKVVAITFTNKAAGEIKERVMEALLEGEAIEVRSAFDRDIAAAVAEVRAHSQRLNWGLLENSSRLRIATFDSFCGSLVRRLPLLSGMGAAAPLSDSDSLYREAILALFRQLDDRSCPPVLAEALQSLLRYGSNRIESLAPLLASLLAKRDQWQDDILNADLDVMEAALAELVEEAFLPQWEVLTRFGVDELFAAYRESSGSCDAHAWAANLPDPELVSVDDMAMVSTLAASLCNGKGELYKPGSAHHAKFTKGQPGTEQVKAWLKRAHDEGAAPMLAEALGRLAILPLPTLPEASRELVGHFCVALRFLLAHLRLVFEQRGGVDFGEIAQRAIMALRSEGQGDGTDTVSEALLLEDRIEHILVDEMQDTSVSQIQLLEALCQGWEPDDGRSVFFCGDLQQSIYAFRGSLVSLFDELSQRGEFAGKALERLQLRANFRSSPDLVNWVNQCFSALFAERGSEYVAALPQRKNPGAVQIHPFAIAKDCDAKAGVAAREAAHIVDIIQRRQAEQADVSIAILVRSRSHLRGILPALKAAGIAFSGQDIDSLTDTPAVMDLMCLLRALWHDADDVAWAGVLRAPFVGLSWDDLLQLRTGGGLLRDAILSDEEAFALRRQGLSQEGQGRVARLRTELQWLDQRPESRDLRWALRTLWYRLGGPACIEAHQQTDIDRVLAVLNEHAPSGILEDITALENALGRLFAAPPVSRVELMTIHKSKGLEFDVVILPGLGGRGRNDDKPLLAWQRLQGHMLFGPRPQASSGPEKRLYDFLCGEQSRALKEELDRLLYVALTRAKGELHVFAAVTANKDGDLVPATGSFLQRLWPMVEGDFERADMMVESDAQLPRRVPLSPRLRDYRVTVNSPWLNLPTADSPLRRVQRQTENAVLEDNIEERAVGIVFHELMEHLGRRQNGKALLSDRSRLSAALRQRLRHHCHPEPELEHSVGRVLELLDNTLACPDGRWILGSYQWQASEQTIRRLMGGQWQTLILDRAFIEDGDAPRCWIVDYKTARSRGSFDEFLRMQTERYAPKMQIYKEALRATGLECPIVAALYFPAHQHLLCLDDTDV